MYIVRLDETDHRASHESYIVRISHVKNIRTIHVPY
jgi:hypothetical protein